VLIVGAGDANNAECGYLVDYMVGAGMAKREGSTVKILSESGPGNNRNEALTPADKAALELKMQGG